MDISGLSSSTSPSQLMSEISNTMLKKTMDLAEQTSDNMIKMMEQSVNPNVGSNIDLNI